MRWGVGVRAVGIAATATFALWAGSSIAGETTNRVWKRFEILAIADAEAKRLGYDVEQMSVSFNVFNTDWQKYLGSLERVKVLDEATGQFRATSGEEQRKETAPLLAPLQGRMYWAVYYARLEASKGGDLWVFVDREIGDVIHRIRGQ